MKSRFKKSFLFISTIAFLIIPNISSPEIIYLKDGQVLKGAIIHEDKESITLQTKYQARKIYRDHIKRILYGDRAMEKINILLRNGKILRGFLVDQDAEKVIFREKRDSTEEVTLRKVSIKQMSPDEIKLLSPDIFFHLGYYLPVSKGKTELSISPLYTLGSGINFIWINRTRLTLEAGYSRIRGKENKDEYMQNIPVTLNSLYSIPFAHFNLVPKIGMGCVISEFKDSENNRYRSYDLTAGMGAGMEYGLTKKINIGIWMEYNMIFEKGTVFSGVVVKTGLGFVF